MSSEHSEPIEMCPGVLSAGQMNQLVREGFISKRDFEIPKPGASAIDLCLGKKAWKLGEGNRPTTRELAKLTSSAQEIALERDKDGDYFTFDARCIYLVALDPLLKLPSNISGRATGKSSIGRLDVITRLIANDSREYDVVPAGYDGPLYLLVLPQTFSVKVNPGESLNQLRLFCGAQYETIIRREHVPHYGTEFWYKFDYKKKCISTNASSLPSTKDLLVQDPTMFDLTVDLEDPDEPFIFKARNEMSNRLLDIRKTSQKYHPEDYFEQVRVSSEAPDRFVVLETNSFYIMKSRERLHIPNDVAVEVIAISERIGDIRIHYAGFAHPGFGREPRADSKKGTPLIFEVRATDMNTKLSDGAILARVQLFRMSERTEPDDSPYGQQELKLSKYFADWGSSK